MHIKNKNLIKVNQNLKAKTEWTKLNRDSKIRTMINFIRKGNFTNADFVTNIQFTNLMILNA
jgi:predicted patatin/cPLA2 family phospholipase